MNHSSMQSQSYHVRLERQIFSTFFFGLKDWNLEKHVRECASIQLALLLAGTKENAFFFTISRLQAAILGLLLTYLKVDFWSSFFSSSGGFIWFICSILFKRFKTTWPNIGKTTYEDLSTNGYTINAVITSKIKWWRSWKQLSQNSCQR